MKTLLRVAASLLMAANGFAALRVLHTTHSDLPAGTSATLSFSTTPTAGDLLIVFLSVQDSASTVTGSAGWSKLDEAKAGGVGTRLLSFAYVVSVGDANSYVFTSGASLDHWEFVGYEVTGQAASSYVNQHGIANIPAAGTVIATPSLTPSVTGTLVISGLGANNSSRRCLVCRPDGPTTLPRPEHFIPCGEHRGTL